MNHRRLLLTLLLALAPACAASGPTEGAATTDQAESAVSWTAAIRCDGAVLDVNLDERRELQFVIRDGEAIEHLVHSVDLPSVPPGTVNMASEFILHGRVDRGVFFARDFSAATVKNGAITGWVSVAGDNADAPGAGGSGDPSDLIIQFGEYTNWRFRNCRGEI